MRRMVMDAAAAGGGGLLMRRCHFGANPVVGEGSTTAATATAQASRLLECAEILAANTAA
jgi:hypothetical protein